MLYLKRPHHELIQQWLQEQSLQTLTYDEVGGTGRPQMPGGYHHIEFRDSLGEGQDVYNAAVEALSQWSCFNLAWTRLAFDGKPDVGNHVATATRIAGLWSVHCCRVVASDFGISNPFVEMPIRRCGDGW